MNMRPTPHDKREWARLSDDAIAKGKDDISHTFALAASLGDDAEMSIGLFDKLQAVYQSWLIDGFQPDMDAIKTREINLLVRENRALLADRDDLVAVLHEARNVVSVFIGADTESKVDDSLWLEFQRRASDVLYKVTGKP